MTWESKLAEKLSTATGLSVQSIHAMIAQAKAIDPMELAWTTDGFIVNAADRPFEERHLFQMMQRSKDTFWDHEGAGFDTAEFMRSVCEEHNEVLRRKKAGTW